MKHYDNYDYESAYDKQAEKLQEWEIEKLISEQRVSCLYRTTTNRAKNLVSGRAARITGVSIIPEKGRYASNPEKERNQTVTKKSE